MRPHHWPSDAGPVKIALLSYEYPPETGFGGIGTYTWYQARGLVRAGHDVHVLAGATEPSDLRESEHDGVRVFRYRADFARSLRVRALRAGKLWWSKNRLENGISMERGLRRLLERHVYDIVEMPECGADGLRIAGRIDAPTLIKLHSPAQLIMSTYDVRKADIILCSFLERRAMRRVTAVTSCSQFLAREVQTKLGIGKHIEVIYNGIDLTLFDKAPQFDARERFDIPHDVPMIFFAGRLEPRKGIHVLKDAAARVLANHEAAFVFAGDDMFGYAEKEMKPFLDAQDLRGTYHFLGQLDLAGVRSCLRQADIFVIPSLWENCPYSCLEAMAAGRAIVASDAGGLPELIEHDVSGLVAATEDVTGTVDCLERLLADADLRRRCGDAARRSVEESLTDVHIAEQSAAYYAKVIAH